jgi:hypothetical protein
MSQARHFLSKVAQQSRNDTDDNENSQNFLIAPEQGLLASRTTVATIREAMGWSAKNALA